MTCGSGWVISPFGVSSAPRVVRCLRSSPLRLTLSPDTTSGGPRRLAGNAWGAQFGAVCRDLPYLTHGPLPSDLCPGSAEYGDCADPVWATPTGLFPGRREA